MIFIWFLLQYFNSLCLIHFYLYLNFLANIHLKFSSLNSTESLNEFEDEPIWFEYLFVQQYNNIYHYHIAIFYDSLIFNYYSRCVGVWLTREAAEELKLSSFATNIVNWNWVCQYFLMLQYIYLHTQNWTIHFSV